MGTWLRRWEFHQLHHDHNKQSIVKNQNRFFQSQINIIKEQYINDNHVFLNNHNHQMQIIILINWKSTANNPNQSTLNIHHQSVMLFKIYQSTNLPRCSVRALLTTVLLIGKMKMITWKRWSILKILRLILLHFSQVLIWLHVVQVVKGSLAVQAAQDKGEPGKHN